jgi:fatty-acyl-CoA synthase
MPAHHAFWPKRLPHQLTAPQTSLWMNLQISALRFPGKEALVFMGQTWTYAQFMHQAESIASALRKMGVQKGDRVVLDMQNCPQLVITHFAILRLDAVVVPVNPMNRMEELKHYILDPDTKVAVTTADLAPELAAASNALESGQRLQHLLVTQFTDAFDPKAMGPDDLPNAWRDWLSTFHALPVLEGGQVHAWREALQTPIALGPVTATPDDLAVLPYTSGTTGLPKGCMHTHGTIMHNAMASGIWAAGTPENKTLCVVPMFHITGMVSVMHSSIYIGATLVLMPRWDRDLAGRLISQWKITHWTNIPTMVIDLLGSPNMAQFDLSSLVNIGGGGAAMPEAVAQRLLDQFGLKYIEGYGLTETAAPSHTNPPDAPKKQCLGIPFMSVDARVVDPETLKELPQGESGEIVISGPQVFKGYWKRPDATASAFKVWPAEVEALMFKHPAIQEACIISTKDTYRGESVKAVVVLRSTHKGQVSEQDIINWCRETMAVYKVPRVVEFIDALPKSGSGKVMWRALQEAEMAKA